MAHFDDIYEIAADNYGLINAAQAAEAGVVVSELNRWARAGMLERRGHGLYKLVRYTPTAYDRFAEAVALVGADAHLTGTAVLAMHGLAFANPPKITVATTKRVRKKLPEWIELMQEKEQPYTYYEGIPSQSVSDALISCRGKVMTERLLSAVEDAYANGLIKDADRERILKELS